MESLKKFIYDQLAADNLSIAEARKLLKELQTKSTGPTDGNKDIAVIGIAGRFGTAEDVTSFWQDLLEGQDFVTHLPEARQESVAEFLEFKNLTREDVIIREGGYLREVADFDPDVFGISAREASLLDPNQRLFLEIAWKAIEDAGYGGGALAGSNTGIFIGFSQDFGDRYKQLIKQYSPAMLPMATLGNINSVIASRLSYLLNLKGPAMLIDTACSSSLVAVHMACQSIRNGDSDLAIAGGVKIWNLPVEEKSAGEFGGNTGPGIGIESSDGRCHTFDDSASGAGFGEGVGAILLKPLKQALADRDPIYAVIKGSAVNQDGKSIGIAAPNVLAQEAVLQKAWKNADIPPETLSYIEAHGTGTRMGDPIEIYAIQNSFEKYTNKKQFCAVGSVKSNIGHLDHAAGIVGMIKVILALKNRILPPSINFDRPNKEIDFINSPVYVNDKLRTWLTDSDIRRAGISAFGLSGTNCHIVLEEPPVIEYEEDYNAVNILTLSANSERALERLVNKFVSFLNQKDCPNLANLCFTVNTGRGDYKYRLAMIVQDKTDLWNKLQLIDVSNLKTIEDKRIFCGILDRSQSQQGIYTGDYTNLIEVARRYVQGDYLDWNQMYGDKRLQRINLPTYQFDNQKYWIKPDKSSLKINQSSSNDEFYHQTRWIPLDLKTEQKVDLTGTVVILTNNQENEERLFKHLQDEKIQIIRVQQGQCYQKINENHYIISDSRGEYSTLFSELAERNISAILHLLTFDNQEIDSVGDLETAQSRGFYSLFYIIKALEQINLKNQIQLLIISDYARAVTGSEETIKPENICALGLGKVINQESFQITCKSIDLDKHTDLQVIVSEMITITKDTQIAYRNGQRFVEELKSISGKLEHRNKLVLKETGVYVITGGLGGIGLEIGKLLVSLGSKQGKKVNLALISRRPLPPREVWDQISDTDPLYDKLTTILQMEGMGANVVYYSGDVANYSRMELIMLQLRKQFTKINGLLHTAGAAGDKLMVNKSFQQIREVLTPKIAGTWILDKLTRDDTLDFFVLFSSISAAFGGPGQGDYAAANLYQNSFADYRNRLGLSTVVINWTAWKEVGMARNYQVNWDDLLLKPLSTAQGLDLFIEILEQNIQHVMVGQLNLSNISNLADRLPIRLSSEIKSDVVYGLNQTKLEEVKVKEKTGAIERQIAKIWGNVLGLNELSVDDNFYDLGGDSIIALTLLNEIDKEFPGIMDVTDLFSQPTVRSIAKLIAIKTREPVNYDQNTDEKLLNILDQLEKGELSSEKGLGLLLDLEEKR